MKRYEVKWFKFIGESVVEANNETEAKEKALENVDENFRDAGQDEYIDILEVNEIKEEV